MNPEILFWVIVLSFITWWVWLWWNSYVPKRKNEDVGFAEKPKRKRVTLPEQETFEHTQVIYPLSKSTTVYPDGPTTIWSGHSTRWAGGDVVNLLELEDQSQIETEEVKPTPDNIPDWLTR